MEYRKCTLGELCNVVTDYVANGSFKALADNVKYKNIKGYARVIRLVDFNNNYDIKDSIWVDEHGYEYLKKSKLFGGEVVITNVGANLGTVFIVPNLKIPMTLGPNAIMLKSNESDLFLYYWLISQEGKNKIKAIVTGSAMPKFNKTDLKNIELLVPNFNVQNKIVKILKQIDEKIELNNQINDNLLEFMNNLYKKYFIEDKNIKLKKISDFLPVITGKKNANIATLDGKYPFFTCSQNISYTDTYSFDSDSILLAGNGDFNVKFYRGKFEAYQRTYVLTPYNKEYLGFLYQSIKYNLNKITSGYRGSVINFITKGNIENCEIPFREDEKLFLEFQKTLESMEALNKENQSLEQLRDTLLPKLMNGEIDLEKIEI